jgi:hypothetical protein
LMDYPIMESPDPHPVVATTGCGSGLSIIG